MIDVVSAVKRFDGSTALDGLSLAVERDKTVVLLGPSGCGKTTLLRAIAGLEQLDSGTISIAGKVVSGGGKDVPPEHRDVGLVFQDWALFPHMTVGENVAYGIGRGVDRAQRVADVLDMVGLGGAADRMPATLSGGQQQRVALARSLAPRPKALLLDEPFSNLDSSLRAEVRREVHQLLVELGITTVIVTHDQEEAFILGDRVAVMRAGVIEQFGSPETIYNEPSSAWVATFAGKVNLLDAVATGETATTPVGVVSLREPAEGAVDIALRPENLRVEAPAARSATATGAYGVVDLVEFRGHDHLLAIALGGDSAGATSSSATVTVLARGMGAPEFERGDQVWVSPSADACMAFATGDDRRCTAD